MGYLKNFSDFSSFIIKRFCSKKANTKVMRYLNVAEKNDAAKNISVILSKGSSNRREGLSPYNKIYEFTSKVLGDDCQMVMTSVSGHLLNFEFVFSYRNWQSCHPVSLFDAPVIKSCSKDFEKIKKTLEREIRSCQGLIIWTDCDREGENIGFEVIKVCTDVKPNIRIYRAKFSEITAASVFRALNTLGQPNQNISDAVDVRQELDLRTGAAFTRLQTLRFQQVFPQKLSDKLISYGSCQFPTLGFVVERYQEIEDFIPEPFWKIKMTHTVKELTTDYSWRRNRLFDKNACQAILDHCKENPTATVETVETKPKSKWRPLPLDTVEMEKNISKKLRITAKETMKIAEKLYTQGYISYPRTETNIFPKELNLVTLVEQQQNDQVWGPFARRIMAEGGPTPRQGKKSDQAHPPIHPTKYGDNLNGNEKKVYEFIVRHFLACVHKDAQGFETTVNVDIAGEKFVAKGLIILEKNYLDVYIYEKWNTKEINNYEEGDSFMPTVLELNEGSTAPPKLLTEADLIALMEKHGIGTDATHADHIDTIKSREYVGLHDIYFVPGTLGMGLVEGYNNIGLDVSLAKPILRSEFENDLKMICDGLKDPEVVKTEQIAKYKSVFQAVTDNLRLIDESLAKRLDDRPQAVQQLNVSGNDDYKPALKCPKCGQDMIVRSKKDGSGKFISCVGYPGCKNAIWLPTLISKVEVTDQSCPRCGPNYKLLKFTFKPNPFPGDPNPNILCIGGCDSNLLQVLSINLAAVKKVNETSNGNLNNTNIVYNSRPSESQNRNNTSTSIQRVQVQNNRNSTNTMSQPPSRISFGLLTAPSEDPSNRGTGDYEVFCSCNQKTVLLTVRKDGPNKGKQFYKCATGNCNFFLWDPHDPNNIQGVSTGIQQQHNREIRCRCHLPAPLRTVNKEGPNKGRQFYCCSKITDKCNFFKWADDENDVNHSSYGGDDDNSGSGNVNWSFRAKTNRGRGRKNNRTTPYNSNTQGAGSRPRKCGKCGQPGHRKTNCPN